MVAEEEAEENILEEPAVVEHRMLVKVVVPS